MKTREIVKSIEHVESSLATLRRQLICDRLNHDEILRSLKLAADNLIALRIAYDGK